MFFSIVFKSYVDDEMVILKNGVHWNLFYGWKDIRLPWNSNPDR